MSRRLRLRVFALSSVPLRVLMRPVSALHRFAGVVCCWPVARGLFAVHDCSFRVHGKLFAWAVPQ